MIHNGGLAADITIAAFSAIMFRQLRPGQKLLKIGVLAGLAAVPIGLLGWLLTRNPGGADLGIVSAGICGVLIIVAAFRGEITPTQH